MASYSPKQQRASYPDGLTIRNEPARLSKVVQRLADSLGLNRRWNTDRGFVPFAVVSGCVIFLLGLSLPIGAAAGLLYTSIVLLGLWSPQRYAALWIAGGGTVFLVLGFAVSTADGSTVHVMIDRTFTLMTLWIVAVVGHLHNQQDREREYLAHVKTLEGVLSICVSCKKVRDEDDPWHGVETYFAAHSRAVPYQAFCPDCQRMRLRRRPPVEGII